MQKATRGSGILENFLSRERIKIALRNIPNDKYSGSVLDIGCGSDPFFLRKAPFKERFGIDQVAGNSCDGIKLYKESILELNKVNFKKEYFDAITLLAVIEHIYPEDALKVITEARDLLKNGGVMVLTTPARWTDKLLRFLSKINLVSKEEIEEHKDLFTQNKLRDILVEAGFRKQNIKAGTFEIGMNLFAVAKK